MKNVCLAVVIFSSLILSTSFAQNDPGGAPPEAGRPFGQNANPKMQVAFKKYQPVFDLVSTINLIIDMDQIQAVAVTKDQARKLMPILKDLSSRMDLKPADATKILTNIEDKILTDKQVTWMDDTRLKQQEERRKRVQAAGATTSVRLPGFPGPTAGNRQGGPGGGNGADRRAQMDAMLNGKAFNPFKSGRTQEFLKELMSLVAKRV